MIEIVVYGADRDGNSSRYASQCGVHNPNTFSALALLSNRLEGRPAVPLAKNIKSFILPLLSTNYVNRHGNEQEGKNRLSARANKTPPFYFQPVSWSIEFRFRLNSSQSSIWCSLFTASQGDAYRE